MIKRHLLILIGLSFIFSLSGQTQRLVLVEEATNASCTPCGAQNPAFFALLNQNRDKLTAVVYHWYFPGYDPMHLHNVGENNARVSYYGINGVPTAIIDGVIPSGAGFGYPGAPSGFTQALINQYHSVPSPFEIDIYHYLSPDEEYIHTTARIKATQDFEGNVKLQLAVVEKVIQFSSPPGSNGETTFHDVMKKMMPNHLGTVIPAVWEDGDYIIIEESWQLANIYEMDQLGVVGFIQESPSKTVHQAGNSEPEMFAPLFDNDAAIFNLTNLTATNCSGDYSPVITLANYGANTLTSAEIHYSVNDGPIYTFNWSGNLGFLEKTVVELPEIIFPVLPQNQLVINLSQPNGEEDDYFKNNTIEYDFNVAMATPTEVKLMIKLDDNPDKITWEIKNMDGDVVFSGGPYSVAGETINEIFDFENNGCYFFTIYDADGDGLQPPGFFALYYGSGTQIASGTAFGTMFNAQFDVGGTVAVDEVIDIENLAIFPNPMHQSGIVEFRLMNLTYVEIQIHNMVGQLVKTIEKNQFSAGIHQIPIDVSGLDTGFYMVTATVGHQLETKKIAVFD
jgi:hypothetical protein